MKRASAKKREALIHKLQRTLWREQGILEWLEELNGPQTEIDQAANDMVSTARALTRVLQISQIAEKRRSPASGILYHLEEILS